MLILERWLWQQCFSGWTGRAAARGEMMETSAGCGVDSRGGMRGAFSDTDNGK